MSIDLQRETGKYICLLSPSIEKAFNNQMRLLITDHLRSLVEKKMNKNFWDDDILFVKYLNFVELQTIILNPPGRGEKAVIPLYHEEEAPVYEEDKIEFDKDGKKKITKGKRLKDPNGKWMKSPSFVEKKEYCKIGTHIRKAMSFLVAQFYDTLHQFYDSKGGDFPDTTEFHETFMKFAYNSRDSNSTHAIISLYNLKSETHLSYPEFIEAITEPVNQQYAEIDDERPEIVDDILEIAFDYIEHFTRIVCSLIANTIFEKRKSVEISTVYGVLRNINSMFHMNKIDSEFSEVTFEMISQYILWKKPTAPKKTKPKTQPVSNSKEMDKKLKEVEGSFNFDFDYDDDDDDESI